MFLFMAETQMMSEVEAIRDGWRVVHVCWREEEKNRGSFFFFEHVRQHILMRRHTHQTQLLVRPLR